MLKEKKNTPIDRWCVQMHRYYNLSSVREKKNTDLLIPYAIFPTSRYNDRGKKNMQIACKCSKRTYHTNVINVLVCDRLLLSSYIIIICIDL